jgi:hypothetical protein
VLCSIPFLSCSRVQYDCVHDFIYVQCNLINCIGIFSEFFLVNVKYSSPSSSECLVTLERLLLGHSVDYMLQLLYCRK